MDFLRARARARARANLAEVGHHGVDGVAQQRDVALGPRLEDRGGAVVEVALLDLGLLGHAEDVVDLGRPAFEEGAQVDMTHTGIGPNDAH